MFFGVIDNRRMVCARDCHVAKVGPGQNRIPDRSDLRERRDRVRRRQCTRNDAVLQRRLGNPDRDLEAGIEGLWRVFFGDELDGAVAITARSNAKGASW